MDPKQRPTEYAIALVAAIFTVLVALGVSMPDALPAAVTALVGIIVTGFASSNDSLGPKV